MFLAKAILGSGDRIVAAVEGDAIRPLDLEQVDSVRRLCDVLHHADPLGLARFLVDTKSAPISLGEVTLLPPIDRQEVWAAGVTYKRSQVARMEESESGASHYDRVYTADRPELFFKSAPQRVSGPGEPVRVRADSTWTVPEPELTLVISPAMKVVGLTIGNDMSARDIEGENPLYLPQAKVYDQCCAVGPWVLLPEKPIEREELKITLVIERGGKEINRDQTNAGQMARDFDELVGWLGREYELPDGAFLLTGTGIVPPDDLTLEDGDRVSITIDGIGTLKNPVVKGRS
ncbi:MAG: fumarylacetoacetate hydrolase family protein [Planctomycetota bacterium]|nr:fumarylacetoacetate hydrolase family protein [Planctomycetaceae bacterium]MDQ3332271.1 fumarylacetoacetate hydrolase family protein [Planctomycetota bacterium]